MLSKQRLADHFNSIKHQTNKHFFFPPYACISTAKIRLKYAYFNQLETFLSLIFIASETESIFNHSLEMST